MKMYITSVLLPVTVSIGLLGFISQTSEPKKLIAETNHSTIQFSVPISNGLTRITGKFNEFTIDIELINNDITRSRISAIIKVNSVNTGIAGRDEDLKTKDFFDSEKFPEITFVSDKIEKNGNEFMAHGQFQMHGVKKDISIPFRINGQSGEDVIGFSSRYSIKRTDFGVGTEWNHKTEDNFIGNEIGV
jgi:polyisoprenoid-binding protein YceI